MEKTSTARASSSLEADIGKVRQCKYKKCAGHFFPKRKDHVFCSPSCKTKFTMDAYERGLKVIESKGMHAASFDKSERLQRFIEALKTGPKTTRELIETTGLCAINSIAAECRANGIKVGCTYQGTTESGARVYQYELRRL